MQYDGFIFVTAEYNQSITGALKNAIDSMKDFHDKSVPHISQVTLRVTSLQNSSIFYQELLG
jgi:NAD(P)H-dependent FMN reductase